MKTQQKDTPTVIATPVNLTLGKFAHQVIAEQYRHMVKQEKHVLADKDPEHLHQMRVGGRRLYTALQVFEQVVHLPKASRAKQVRSITKVLGQLRDLDVQILSLQVDYLPQLQSKAERKGLEEALTALALRRRKVLVGARETLTQSHYRDFRESMEAWLEKPHFTRLAELPLLSVLPDLLSPLLSTLLLHPGWLIALDDLSEETALVLHDLRKACKHARYQAEFFVIFYDQPFKLWIGEIKSLQERLGKLQDTQVLQELLTRVVSERHNFKELHQVMAQQQQQALSQWDEIRQRYLAADYRHYLRQLILLP